jgi:hypothetical protein
MVPPGDGMHHLVFRAGVERIKPVEALLPDSAGELKKLEELNKDKSAGDITRQPIWPFFGEAIDATSRPSPSAMISALSCNETAERYMVEVFRNVGQFHVFTEALDSVFQAAARRAFMCPKDADIYFKGVLRFYMLAFN